jgi:ubiquinone/menaquinone biosynthesis C-methylase UbiE
VIVKRREEQRDIERFSRWADSYEHSRIQHYLARIHDAMLAAVASEAGSPNSILDVGCGTGRFLRKIGQRWPNARLIGVDPAEGMIAVARRLAPAISFQVASAESIPVPSASVDLAFSAVSLHHWSNQLQGLQEIARTLRPGGYVCLADITMPRWVSQLVHSKVQSTSGIRCLLAQTGLELHVQRPILARVIVVAAGRKPATAAQHL